MKYFFIFAFILGCNPRVPITYTVNFCERFSVYKDNSLNFCWAEDGFGANNGISLQVTCEMFEKCRAADPVRKD